MTTRIAGKPGSVLHRIADPELLARASQVVGNGSAALVRNISS